MKIAGSIRWKKQLAVLSRYALLVLLLNFVWEIAQLPLYTLWWNAPVRDVAFAVVHCTVGDLIIALASLLLAVILFGNRRWPDGRFRIVTLATMAFGLGYTVFSEWLNVYVRETWSYSAWMPIVPGLGIGLTPLLQWIVVPAAGLTWIDRVHRRSALRASNNTPAEAGFHVDT